MLPSLLAAALAASSLIPSVAGHAGGHTQEEVRAELALRKTVTAHARRAVGNCANSPAAEALKQSALARRIAAANAIREKRGLDSEHVRSRRDTASLQKWSTISHEKTSLGTITLDTPASTLFASNATCALVPETVIGPYYVEGELIRTDITDGQAGVPVHLDIQFVYLTTCAGIESLLIDIWHCNSTGIYSGVAAEGQGGLSTTHGRGAQQTDSDGVVQFDTIFPGHYTGRANHIHVMATAEAELLPNATFTGGTARHIGQLYFDQSLIAAVEQLSPYSTNTQPLTTNAEDSIAPDQATAEYDPFLSYVMLGDSLQDGLLMWITVGLNTSADYSANVAAAAHYYEDGGVALDNGMGPGGSGVSDGLSLPSGFPPSGGLPPSGAMATGNRGANTTASGVVASGPTTTIATTVLTAGAARRGWGVGRH